MQYRYSKVYSRKVLSGLAGISKTFLYEIKTGRKGFSVVILFALADALEIAATDIIAIDKKRL
ncbi:MAG: XRE family transcriptional regulator [Clostridiaceae bacterium]|nr:XRE family transcriptional regulator [Clostridiaceae bacterium]